MAQVSDIQERFIANCKKNNSGDYDYSESMYVNLSTPVIIRCRKHGNFTAKPNNLYCGYGCVQCKKERDVAETSKRLIKEGLAKHKGKYDYTKFNFINTRTHINIICPMHGEQSMYWATHIAGTGCPKCSHSLAAKNSTKSKETVFKKFKKTHGDRYDYSIAEYVNTDTKIDIICKDHGIFNIKPIDHYSRGCPECGNISRQVSKEAFINRSREVHGNRYGYGLVVMRLTDNTVDIVCKEHGVFSQYPYVHMKGGGCRKCADGLRGHNSRLSTKDFIKKSKEVRGNRYDYSKTKYVKKGVNVTIGCNIHGDFQQEPSNHLAGSNCNKCGYLMNNDHVRLSTSEFIKRSKKLHGNNYDYSKVSYRSGPERVEIHCKKHKRKFMAVAVRHMQGNAGCPECYSTKGERRVFLWLEENNIEYVREYCFPKSRYRYDFYIESLGILIERHDVHHYRPVEYWGGEEFFEKMKFRDKLKNAMAKQNNLKLIRVPYTKYNDLERYLRFRISRYYRYRVDGKFYKDFLSLCRGLDLPKKTKLKDVSKHLFYKTN